MYVVWKAKKFCLRWRLIDLMIIIIIIIFFSFLLSIYLFLFISLYFCPLLYSSKFFVAFVYRLWIFHAYVSECIALQAAALQVHLKVKKCCCGGCCLCLCCLLRCWFASCFKSFDRNESLYKGIYIICFCFFIFYIACIWFVCLFVCVCAFVCLFICCCFSTEFLLLLRFHRVCLMMKMSLSRFEFFDWHIFCGCYYLVWFIHNNLNP